MKKFLNQLARVYAAMIHSNKFLIVLSVLIGALAWVYIVNMDGYEKTAEITKVPIKIDSSIPESHNLSILFDGTNYTTNVTVEGSRAKLATFSADKLTAYLDMSQVIAPNTYKLTVNVVSSDPDVKVKSCNPSTISFQTDYTITKKFPVTVELAGSLPEGYVVKSQEVYPSEIEVSGPESVVNSIATVSMPIDINGQKAAKLSNLGKLSFLTSENENVNKTFLTISSEQATYSLDIVYRKKIPLQPQLVSGEGNNENKYIVAGCDPETVVVEGEESEIAMIDTIRLPEINTEEMAGSEQTFSLKLPEGFHYVDNVEYVNVKLKLDSDVTVKEYRFTSKQIDAFIFTNVPDGKTAKIKTTSFSLPVRSLKYILDTVSVSDIIGTIDLSQTPNEKGEYPVKFTIPDTPYGIMKKIYVKVELS